MADTQYESDKHEKEIQRQAQNNYDWPILGKLNTNKASKFINT